MWHVMGDMWCDTWHALWHVFQSHVNAGVVTFPKWCHTRGPSLFLVICDMWCVTCDVWCNTLHALWHVFQSHVDAGVVTFPKWCHTRGPGLFLVICDICDMYCVSRDVWCNTWHALWRVFQSHVNAGVVTFPKWCNTRGPSLFLVSCDSCDMWYVM